MSLSEGEIAKLGTEADAAFDDEIRASAAATWRAIEADFGYEKVAELERFMDDLRHRLDDLRRWHEEP